MIFDSGSIPGTDPFTYSIHGQPWNNHQWVYEVLVSVLHRHFGWGGSRVAVLLIMGGSVIGTWLTVSRRAGRSELDHPESSSFLCRTFLYTTSR